MFGSMMGAVENMLAIVLPAADILDSAQQAPPFGGED